MKNPVQKMLKAAGQMKNNPQLAQRVAQSPNKVNAIAAQMVIPEQQAMQNSKPIPHPVGSVLMQKLAQAQQAAMAAKMPQPSEGGIAQMAAKGGVLKFAKRGKVPKDPLPEDLITSEENSIRNLGEQLEQGRKDIRNQRNQKADLGLGKEPAEQKKLTSQERGVKTALQKQGTRMTKNAAAVDRAVLEARGRAEAAKQPSDPLADPNATTKRKTAAARAQGAKEYQKATAKPEAPKSAAVSPEDASYAKRMTEVKRRGESYETTPKNRIQRPAQHTSGAPVSREDLEVKRVGARPTGIEQSVGSGLQNPTERGKGIEGKAPSYEGIRSTGRGTVNKPAAVKPVPGQKPSESELTQRKADKYKAAEAAEKEGAPAKQVSREAKAYEAERAAKASKLSGAKAAKAASPASLMENLTGSVKGFFSKNPDLMANARQIAQDVLAKNPEATMDEIGAAIKRSATPEAIQAMEAEIAPTLEKHGLRDFFSKAAGAGRGVLGGLGAAAGTAAVAYPVAAGVKDVLDEKFDAQNKFNRALRDVGNAIIPAAQADEPADAETQRLEQMGRGQMSIEDIAGPARAPQAPAAPAAPAVRAAATPAPQGVAQAAPAPQAPAGGITASPQAPKYDLYAGDTSQDTPEGAMSELMKLQGPGYQYSPEVMGMLKDAKEEERGNTLLKMIGMTGAGLANRDRYAGAHDAALLATQAFTSGTEREDEARKQFLQGIIHNEQVPFEQRAKAYNDYITMQKTKATNESLMARAGMGLFGKMYGADVGYAGRVAGGSGSGVETERKSLDNQLDYLSSIIKSKQLTGEDTTEEENQARAVMAKLRGLSGMAGDEGLGQTKAPRLTLDAFK